MKFVIFYLWIAAIISTYRLWRVVMSQRVAVPSVALAAETLERQIRLQAEPESYRDDSKEHASDAPSFADAMSDLSILERYLAHRKGGVGQFLSGLAGALGISSATAFLIYLDQTSNPIQQWLTLLRNEPRAIFFLASLPLLAVASLIFVHSIYLRAIPSSDDLERIRNQLVYESASSSLRLEVVISQLDDAQALVRRVRRGALLPSWFFVFCASLLPGLWISSLDLYLESGWTTDNWWWLLLVPFGCAHISYQVWSAQKLFKNLTHIRERASPGNPKNVERENVEAENREQDTELLRRKTR